MSNTGEHEATVPKTPSNEDRKDLIPMLKYQVHFGREEMLGEKLQIVQPHSQGVKSPPHPHTNCVLFSPTPNLSEHQFPGRPSNMNHH